MSQITTVFVLAKSSHFLVCIILAVRTPHFQFAFYCFAISQFANYQTPVYLKHLQREALATTHAEPRMRQSLADRHAFLGVFDKQF